MRLLTKCAEGASVVPSPGGRRACDLNPAVHLGPVPAEDLPRSPGTALAAGSEDKPVITDSLPEGYAELLATGKADVVLTRELRVTRTANTEMISLYWRIGQLILDRQDQQGWGAQIINRLSADLKRELPGTRGWSVSNRA